MASESPKDRSPEPLTERRERHSGETDSRPTHVDDPTAAGEPDSDSAPSTPHVAFPASGSEQEEAKSEPTTERRNLRAATARRTGETTLLSLPAPADTVEEEPESEPRVVELERRLTQLEARVRVLEVGGKGNKRWLAWIAFMVTLAVIWQIARQAR
jgi:hypothetical protein